MATDENKRRQMRALLAATEPEPVSRAEFVKSFQEIVKFLKKYEAECDAKVDGLVETVEKAIETLKSDSDSFSKEFYTQLEGRVGKLVSKLNEDQIAALERLDKRLMEVVDGKDADEEKVILAVLSQIHQPKDGSPDTPEEIVKKLESIPSDKDPKKDKRLDKSAVKGLEDIISNADLQRAISILDQRTQYLINKRTAFTLTTNGSSGAATYNDGVLNIPQYSGGSGGGVETIVAGIGITVDATDPANPIVATTITQYTNEMAQDAVGGMVDSTLVYVDATPILKRAPITGDISIPDGSNTAAISAGVIVDADINASAAITLSKLAALTVSRAVVSDGSGVISVATTTATEIGYVNGVTSAIQTQLNSKAPTASPTFTGTVTLPTGLTGVLRADSGVVSVDTDVTDLVSAASTTLAGKVELATDAETVTGTDTVRAVTPSNLVAKMAAPGAIGGTTPGSAAFTTAVANSFVPNSSSVPTNGLYLPASNTLGWAINSAAEMQLTASDLAPASSGGLTLGTTSLPWNGVRLSTSSTLVWGSSNVVFTHSTGIVTITTGDLRITSANVGTNGDSVPTLSSASTFTNKRRTRRLTTSNAPGATPTTNTDGVDVMNFTGLATAITSMTTNLSGTPVDGDLLEFRFTDNGTARGITWGASFAATTVALPTTTVISTMLRVGFERSGSIWQCIAVA